MHVLIYDPMHAGHHLHWVRLMVRECAPSADRITFATTRRAATSIDFAEHLGDDGTRPLFALDDTVDFPEPRGTRFESFGIARRAWAGLAAAVARHRPDHVFVPFGDALVAAPLVAPGGPGRPDLGLPAGCLDAVFLHSGEFAYRRGLPLRRRAMSHLELFCLHRLPFGRMLFIDSIAYDWLKDHCPRLAPRCALLPDPVGPVRRYEKAAARAALGLPADGRLVSCAGVLDGRKGADDFVRSFAAADLGPADRLLLAGRASAGVREAVREATARAGPGRILCIDRLLRAEEFDLAVSAADLVAVPYRFPVHIGSASLLIKAAGAGRPVLASERGWPGRITREFSLGWIYPDRPADRPRAVAAALEACGGYAPGAAATRFAEFHSAGSFARILAEPLRAKRGASGNGRPGGAAVFGHRPAPAIRQGVCDE